MNSGILHFTVLRFIALRKVAFFYKLKARPSANRRMTAGPVGKLSSLPWSGRDPAISPRSARIYCTSAGVTIFYTLWWQKNEKDKQILLSSIENILEKTTS